MKLNWSSILPEKQNDYKGSKISFYFLILWASIGLIRASIHIFAPDGGAGSIAHFDLNNEGAAALLFMFAALGLSQITFTLFQWIVIFRYRSLIPLTLGLMLFSNILGLYAHFFKPIPNSPPGQIGSYVLTIILPIMFLLSLAEPKTNENP